MEIENLDHLGLAAALVEKVGLVELTDELLEPFYRYGLIQLSHTNYHHQVDQQVRFTSTSEVTLAICF